MPLARSQPAASGNPIDDRRRAAGERRLELEGLDTAIRRNGEERRKLDAEVAGLKIDRAALTQALVGSAAAVRRAETALAASEARLVATRETEGALRRSLDSRRGLLTDVLATLQRMGRKPPPAVVVRPEDILEAVRASIMLGAVLPELRVETEALAVDLGELVRLRAAIATEIDTRRAEMVLVAGERERLAALVDARQSDAARAERRLADESARAQEMSARAGSLRELVARVEQEIAAAERQAERARLDAERQVAREREAAEKLAERERLAELARIDAAQRSFAAAAAREPAKLAPGVAFSQARGSLSVPVAGAALRGYGDPDGAGGAARGVSYASPPRAVVTAPADGWVAFAGPFRSFGQLLIINAGGGYHIVLAGMNRMDVAVGQFVVSGEPVAAMGDENVITNPALSAGSSSPVLYLELRKDGSSFDPGPWWANARAEKVRG